MGLGLGLVCLFPTVCGIVVRGEHLAAGKEEISMPALSIWSIRAALLYFLGGFTLGALLLAHKGMSFYPLIWRFLPAHIEFLLIGWMVQFIFGVAYWILPRFTGGSRGNPLLPLLSIILLNVGIWLVVGQGLWGWSAELVLAGRIAQTLAVVSFAASAWPRVRPFLLS
jgi:hypothetical protein